MLGSARVLLLLLLVALHVAPRDALLVTNCTSLRGSVLGSVVLLSRSFNSTTNGTMVPSNVTASLPSYRGTAFVVNCFRAAVSTMTCVQENGVNISDRGTSPQPTVPGSDPWCANVTLRLHALTYRSGTDEFLESLELGTNDYLTQPVLSSTYYFAESRDIFLFLTIALVVDNDAAAAAARYQEIVANVTYSLGAFSSTAAPVYSQQLPYVVGTFPEVFSAYYESSIVLRVPHGFPLTAQLSTTPFSSCHQNATGTVDYFNATDPVSGAEVLYLRFNTTFISQAYYRLCLQPGPASPFRFLSLVSVWNALPTYFTIGDIPLGTPLRLNRPYVLTFVGYDFDHRSNRDAAKLSSMTNFGICSRDYPAAGGVPEDLPLAPVDVFGLSVTRSYWTINITIPGSYTVCYYLSTWQLWVGVPPFYEVPLTITSYFSQVQRAVAIPFPGESNESTAAPSSSSTTTTTTTTTTAIPTSTTTTTTTTEVPITTTTTTIAAPTTTTTEVPTTTAVPTTTTESPTSTTTTTTAEVPTTTAEPTTTTATPTPTTGAAPTSTAPTSTTAAPTTAAPTTTTAAPTAAPTTTTTTTTTTSVSTETPSTSSSTTTPVAPTTSTTTVAPTTSSTHPPTSTASSTTTTAVSSTSSPSPPPTTTPSPTLPPDGSVGSSSSDSGSSASSSSSFSGSCEDGPLPLPVECSFLPDINNNLRLIVTLAFTLETFHLDYWRSNLSAVLCVPPEVVAMYELTPSPTNPVTQTLGVIGLTCDPLVCNTALTLSALSCLGSQLTISLNPLRNATYTQFRNELRAPGIAILDTAYGSSSITTANSSSHAAPSTGTLTAAQATAISASVVAVVVVGVVVALVLTYRNRRALHDKWRRFTQLFIPDTDEIPEAAVRPGFEDVEDLEKGKREQSMGMNRRALGDERVPTFGGETGLAHVDPVVDLLNCAAAGDASRLALQGGRDGGGSSNGGGPRRPFHQLNGDEYGALMTEMFGPAPAAPLHETEDRDIFSSNREE